MQIAGLAPTSFFFGTVFVSEAGNTENLKRLEKIRGQSCKSAIFYNTPQLIRSAQEAGVFTARELQDCRIDPVTSVYELQVIHHLDVSVAKIDKPGNEFNLDSLPEPVVDLRRSSSDTFQTLL